ncbi:MAG TPA: DUF72 domain-containing protein [Chloroflexota bacterium]|nr:DUF72 domain-containing protein [Chloroflexota bacterium]
MTIYLGTQGWSYKDWVGPFYPPGTRDADFLMRYAENFNAVELDTTFYGTPAAARVRKWYDSTPDGFQFTAKVPRSITHDRHLVDAGDELAEFLAAVSLLEAKLGAVLIQLPPDFTADERPALEHFLDLLPADMRFAAEFRHRSWLEDSTYELLREHGVAWTMIDLRYMPTIPEVTADFTYIRWLGDRRLIERVHATQLDKTARLDAWSERIEEVARRVERVYGFVNNHYSGHSPADVRYLAARLGLPEPPAPAGPEQGSLL